jgi:DNA-binding transcriptional LysR family regulator
MKFRRLRLDFNHLRYFIQVAEAGSLRQAAEKLNVSQPPLGRKISNLEYELGTKLFERRANGVELTEAGREFLVHARDMVSRLSNAADATSMASMGLMGSLSVGYVDDFLFGIITRALTSFKTQHYSVSLRHDMMCAQPIIDKVMRGDLDIGFVPLPLPADASGLAIAQFKPLPLVVVAPRDHPMAERESVSISDFRDETWIWATTLPTSGFYQQIAGLFHRAQISPRIMSGLYPSEMIVHFIAAGQGVGLMTRDSVSAGRGDIVMLPLADRNAAIDLAMIWRRGVLRNTLGSFLKVCDEVMADRLTGPVTAD